MSDELTIGKAGKDGKIGINGKDGKSADITVGKGEAGVDGKDGITRIIYTDKKDNKTHEVATLDDGLKFKGDNDAVVIRKLNTQLNITGGAAAADLSNGNIGVVGTAGDQGGMTVKLSKKLKGLSSAEFKDGDTVTNITGGNISITKKVNNQNETKNIDLWDLSTKVNTNLTTPMNFYFGGKKDGNGYTPGTTNWTMPANEFRMDFGDGLKAEQVEKDGKKYTLVTLDKDSLKKDPAFKGDKGADGAKGADGTNGKSAYELWKEQPGNDRKSEQDFLNSLKGKDGKNGTGTGGASVEAGDKNIVVDKKDPSKAVISLNKNISADSVKVGSVTIDKEKGIDAGGKQITGVAAGTKPTDAVNMAQLSLVNQQVKSNMLQINSLRDESREGDALGAAMAALKPLDFDPYQRSQVMAGVGYYRGKEAVALGLAHYKNEDLMFHGGLAYAGNSELMANIGVTYRFGSKDDRDIKHDRNLRMPQYAEGPISSVYILQDEVERLTKENEEAREQIRNADKKVEEVRREANEKIAALEAKLEQVLKNVK